MEIISGRGGGGGEESKSKNGMRQDNDNYDVHHSLKRKKQKRRRCICLGCISCLLLTALIILILALTVFKAKRPITTVNSLSLADFKVDLDIPKLQVHLNVTLNILLTIKNPNKVGFTYSNTSAFLKYKTSLIGEAPIPPGKIKSNGNTPLNITLTVMADRLLSDSSVYSDVLSGNLPLTTYTKIKGKVRILHLFNIHAVSSTTCDFNINVNILAGGGTLTNQTCHYKTKL